MKCLIFDCDGVLVDSEIITTKYFIKHLDELGHQITMEDCLKRFTGLSAKAVYHELSQETGRVFTPELIKQIETQVQGGMHSEVQAVPGMPQLLDQLQKNTELAICLASSGSLEKINKSLQATQLIKYFASENIFSAQNVKNGKPAPDLFLFAAKQMGYAPQDCIVVEDSEAGIQAALAAKMPVIGFLGGSHARSAWYLDKINPYKIPLAQDSAALADVLKKLL